MLMMIKDREKEVGIHAEIPRDIKADIEINISSKSGKESVCELRINNVIQTVLLSSMVDGKKSKATLNNGFLDVTLPKSDTAKSYTIKISPSY